MRVQLLMGSKAVVPCGRAYDGAFTYGSAKFIGPPKQVIGRRSIAQ